MISSGWQVGSKEFEAVRLWRVWICMDGVVHGGMLESSVRCMSEDRVNLAYTTRRQDVKIHEYMARYRDTMLGGILTHSRGQQHLDSGLH